MRRFALIVLLFFVAGCGVTSAVKERAGSLFKPSAKEVKKEEPAKAEQKETIPPPMPRKEETEQKRIFTKAAPAVQQSDKSQLIGELEKKLAEMEAVQAQQMEENKRLKERLEALSKIQAEAREKQARLEQERKRLKQEEMERKALQAEAKKKKTVKKPKAKQASVAGNNPYTVHVSSHQELDVARQKVKEWRKDGYLAYISLYNSPQKGRWYRVLVDRFKNKKEADKFTAELKETRGITFSRPIFLPYSIEINKFDSFEEAQKAEEVLYKRGYLPYIAPYETSSKGIGYQLLVGAYEKGDKAAIVSKKLEEDGYKNRIVLP